MKVLILAVGKMKASPLLDLCDEYQKRLTWRLEIKELNTPKNAAAADEAPLILKTIPENAFVIALDERGETLSSPDFAAKIKQWQNRDSGKTFVFLIGGADGFDNTVRKKADFLISFGKQTWPHMLVRVMLLEQLYRAQQIIAGHPYHRA